MFDLSIHVSIMMCVKRHRKCNL